MLTIQKTGSEEQVQAPRHIMLIVEELQEMRGMLQQIRDKIHDVDTGTPPVTE